MRNRFLVLTLIAVTTAGCGRTHENQSPRAAATASSSTVAGNAAAGLQTTAAPVQSAEAPDFHPSTVPGMIRIDDKAYLLSSAVWPKISGSDATNVYVCWEPGAPAGQERTWVKDAVTSAWQSHSKLRLLGFGQCAAQARGIRIAVRDDGPDDGPHTVGLGTQIDGKPSGMVLNFSFNTWSPVCASSAAQRESCIRSIAVHEFGHALGFAHEQNRPDTPGECTKKPQGGNGDTLLTPWDAHSVMNYCNPVYNNNGQLSTLDVQGVQKVYGKP